MINEDIWCVFSECKECAHTNKYDPGLPENKEFKFGHIVAIRNTEQEAKETTEKLLNKYYKPEFAFSMKFFYRKWDGDEIS